MRVVGLLQPEEEARLLVRLGCGFCGQSSWLEVAQSESGVQISCYLNRIE